MGSVSAGLTSIVASGDFSPGSHYLELLTLCSVEARVECRGSSESWSTIWTGTRHGGTSSKDPA